MRLSRLAIVPALVLSLVLTGCGGDDDNGDAAPSPTSASPTASTEPTSASPSPSESVSESPSASPSASAATTQSAPLPVNKTISDPVKGDTIVVQSVVRDFPRKNAPAAVADRRIVLVKVKVTTGSTYSGSTSSGDFRIREAGDDIPSTAVNNIDDQLTAAGFTPLGSVRTGMTGEGWMAFQLDDDSPATGLSLVFIRLATKVIGSDTTIPRMEFPVALPEAAA